MTSDLKVDHGKYDDSTESSLAQGVKLKDTVNRRRLLDCINNTMKDDLTESSLAQGVKLIDTVNKRRLLD